jgi:hypothetical protein
MDCLVGHKLSGNDHSNMEISYLSIWVKRNNHKERKFQNDLLIGKD